MPVFTRPETSATILPLRISGDAGTAASLTSTPFCRRPNIAKPSIDCVPPADRSRPYPIDILGATPKLVFENVGENPIEYGRAEVAGGKSSTARIASLDESATERVNVSDKIPVGP